MAEHQSDDDKKRVLRDLEEATGSQIPTVTGRLSGHVGKLPNPLGSYTFRTPGGVEGVGLAGTNRHGTVRFLAESAQRNIGLEPVRFDLPDDLRALKKSCHPGPQGVDGPE